MKFECDAITSSVHDGDTAHFIIDIWHDIDANPRCRLAELYCEELKNKDGSPNQKGIEAAAVLTQLINVKKVRIKSSIKDNWGRPLVFVFIEINKSLVSVNEWMVTHGYGTKIPVKLQLDHPVYSKPPVSI